MGKSYRNVSAGSNSEHYKFDKCRGFAKDKKRTSHHQIRNDNRNCDEESIQTNNFKTEMYMKNGIGSGYWGKIGNVPNMSYKTLDDELYPKNGDYKINKWKQTDGSILETIDNAIINKPDYERNKTSYLKATIKQIERRNEPGIFKGHNRDN